jgi:hypothetical protein
VKAAEPPARQASEPAAGTSSNTVAVGVDGTANLPLAWGSTSRRLAFNAVAIRVKLATDLPILGRLPARAEETAATGVDRTTDLGPELGDEA